MGECTMTSIFEFKHSLTKSDSFLMESYAVECDVTWSTIQNPTSGLPLSTISPLCLAPQNSAECIGVKCNSSTSNCELLKRPPNTFVNCIKSPVRLEKQMSLNAQVVKRQPELAFLDLENGEIESLSVSGIPPISISPIHGTPLQVQLGMGILHCTENATDCHYWSSDSNTWSIFPSFNKVHLFGAMAVLRGKPIVIGGHPTPEKQNHGIVEIFDKVSQQWILGPTLEPARHAIGLVVLNETSLLVVGGYNRSMMVEVQMLNIENDQWTRMDDLPEATYGSVCGLINVAKVICIGGRDPVGPSKLAYGLDMSLSEPKWIREPSFDFEDSAVYGFFYSLRDQLFSMTLAQTISWNKVKILRRMNMTKPNPVWEDIKVYPSTSLSWSAAYFVDGYQFQF
ncbi:uncharacterized protein LOC131892102 isoform X2 [Tigriopus californicus]|uniref:uncharacterized protein LOC131892102 isoform X2 n=1 Tax=Tigriopus californicus TaxID=6832 RepID=UPI0027DA4A45|nr:uncharacterized protein LOC131892102 isoform X2 [Tigriopus californicus]